MWDNRHAQVQCDLLRNSCTTLVDISLVLLGFLYVTGLEAKLTTLPSLFHASRASNAEHTFEECERIAQEDTHAKGERTCL